MINYADLEIGLYGQEADSYTVELRFHPPDDQSARAPGRGAANFDLEKLRRYLTQPDAYGQHLSQSLFADPEIKSEFDLVRGIAESDDRQLRLRLLIDRSARDLHNLRWETLRDPRDGSPLLTNEGVLFSRFLPSSDWRPVHLRPKGDLRALVVIADPEDLGEWGLARVKVAEELGRARQALGNAIQTELVSDPAVPMRVTLTGLLAALRGGYDILYLVCHGALAPTADPPGPYLYLEKEEGGVAPVPGGALVERLKDLDPALRPRLIVLASCQSAGKGLDAATGDEGALSAIGPRLAQEAGTPAVLAMQGNVLIETVARFMPVFFEQLGEHGQVDQAMAAARAAVLDRVDWWMPVLFLRLKGGRIWYTPGFAGDRPGYDRWPALLASIRNGKCTPVLGSELIRGLFGSHREMAHRWAESEGYPLAAHGHENLPQVAQYLATSQDPDYPRGKLLLHACAELAERFGQALTDEQRAVDPEYLSDAERADHLCGLISTLGVGQREQDPLEAHRVLAQLPFAVYITANPDDLLADALREQGKDPVVEVCPWREGLYLPSIYDGEPKYRPTPQRPLVYHLFGHLREPASLVLTEDDHFDYLMWVSRAETQTPPQIPRVISSAWSDHAMLFLGFRMEDWDFRVLFRSILNEDRRSRRRRHKSVAVQISPEASAALPARARRYLEEYFRLADIGMFWGSAEDFTRELGRRWRDRGTGGRP